MSEREFDKFLDILQRWHKDDYYTTADALGDARALFEAEHAKVSEPKLDTRAERAELQVSLLNALSDEMRATNKVNVLILDRVRVLTAQGSLNCERLDRIESLYVPQIQEHVGIISAALENIGETQVVQRAALEGIQGLLVDNEAGIGTLGEGIAAILARLDHDSIAGLWERLGLTRNDITAIMAFLTTFQKEMSLRFAESEKRLDKFDIWFDSWNELRAAALEAGQMEIRQMQAKQRTSSGAEANEPKPRKAGKRPVRKAGKRLKTSKL